MCWRGGSLYLSATPRRAVLLIYAYPGALSIPASCLRHSSAALLCLPYRGHIITEHEINPDENTSIRVRIIFYYDYILVLLDHPHVASSSLGHIIDFQRPFFLPHVVIIFVRQKYTHNSVRFLINVTDCTTRTRRHRCCFCR